MSQAHSRRRSAGQSLTATQLADVAAARPDATLIDRVFEMVAQQIRAGQLAGGRRIASVRQLAEDCGVSRDTVTKAYDKLVAHGFLESRPGSGFYVSARKPAIESRPPSGASRRPMFAPHSFRAQLVGSDGVMDTSLGGGHLPDEWLESAHVAAAYRQVTKGNLRHLHRYSDVLGYRPLRELLRLRLLELGVSAGDDQLMVTAGATEALNLIVMANLRDPAEIVLADAPGPFMTQERLAASGLHVLGVTRQHDGPDVDQLRALCELHRPRFYFCSAMLQSPTSSSIAAHKAFQILRLAEEFDLTLVEDDVYGDLSPPSRAGQFSRLATLDQLRRVIYIGSFSKTLGAGLRIGFVAANPEQLRWLALYRHATQLSGDGVAERVVYQVLSGGNYRYHCEQLRARLDARREPALLALERLGLKPLQRHDAGMYLWAGLREGVDDMALGEAMLRRGFLTAPSQVFDVDDTLPAAMRFNLATLAEGPALNALDELMTTLARPG